MLGRGADVDLEQVAGSIHGRSFELKFEARQCTDPGLRVLANPAVVDQSDGDRIEVMQSFAADFATGDQARGFEEAQVLHNPEASHAGKAGGELAKRLPVLGEQAVEQQSPARVAERLEDVVAFVRGGRAVRWDRPRVDVSRRQVIHRSPV